MNFEEMQVIWNTQNNEKLYAINEAALHAQIKGKGRSVNRLLDFSELMMIAINLIVGIVLIVDVLGDNEQMYEYVLPAMYIVYSVGALVFRLARRKEEVRFDHTILGELDKAIWQINYLIKQGHAVIRWYLLPLMLVVSLTMFYNSKPLWAFAFILVLLPASYFGARWEINKCYLPKKRALESLREKLIAPEP
ncbi:MAG: hypothetical protein ACPGWR_25780 [Ardenticatenaceae bacterium]